MRHPLMIAALVLAIAGPALAEPVDVVGITDGDTVRVLTTSRQELRCRLAQVDAPEKSQAFGMVSRQNLARLIFRRQVELQVTGQDRYGRSICRFWRDGLDINAQQVRDGMAWVYRQYNDDPQLLRIEAEARIARRGLWADAAPVPPWDYRRTKK